MPETAAAAGLFEAEVGGLDGQLVLVGGGVFGERALGDAEDLVADGEAGHVPADGDDRPATSSPAIGCFGLVSP